MLDGSCPLAFAPGLLAAVNPRGSALLPAYVSFLLLDGGERPLPAKVAVRSWAINSAARTNNLVTGQELLAYLHTQPSGTSTCS